MQIDIKNDNLTMTNAIRRHTMDRLAFDLSSCGDCIHHVVVKFSDIRGPHGNDKYCRLQIGLVGMREILVEISALDLFVAIDRASERARRILQGKLTQQEFFSRYSLSCSLSRA